MKPAIVAFVGLGLAVLGPLSANVRLLPPFVGFLLFIAGSLAALGGAVVHTVSLVRGPRTGTPADLYALAGFAPFLLMLSLLTKAGAFPRINDVSTDLNEVPKFVEAPKLPANAGRDMGYPETYKDLARKHYPDLTTKVLPGTPNVVMDRVKNLFDQRSYITITRDDRQANEMELVCESGIFHFQDDVILRFRANRLATTVDMRSKSRDGKGDAGANAARIRDYFRAFQANKWE